MFGLVDRSSGRREQDQERALSKDSNACRLKHYCTVRTVYQNDSNSSSLTSSVHIKLGTLQKTQAYLHRLSTSNWVRYRKHKLIYIVCPHQTGYATENTSLFTSSVHIKLGTLQKTSLFTLTFHIFTSRVWGNALQVTRVT